MEQSCTRYMSSRGRPILRSRNLHHHRRCDHYCASYSLAPWSQYKSCTKGWRCVPFPPGPLHHSLLHPTTNSDSTSGFRRRKLNNACVVGNDWVQRGRKWNDHFCANHNGWFFCVRTLSLAFHTWRLYSRASCGELLRPVANPSSITMTVKAEATWWIIGRKIRIRTCGQLPPVKDSQNEHRVRNSFWPLRSPRMGVSRRQSSTEFLRKAGQPNRKFCDPQRTGSNCLFFFSFIQFPII